MNVGDTLSNRYQIQEKIGQGGMQEVFRAIDGVVEREVVVKTPLDGQTHRRFKQSAIIAAKVNNHGIAKTLDYFEEGERPFLVEEYVNGETLDVALLDFASYIDPPFAAILFGRLTKGIAASHHAGVVHRDLKPSNIMISGGFSLDKVKITDFGIATLAQEILDEEIDNNPDITRSTSGTVKGAIPFMAPEMMFRRLGQPIGSPADVWSLGCMMFLALTGTYPFGVGMEAVLAIGNGERKGWPGFMTSDPQFRPVAEELQRIVEMCLSQDPNARPTALELIDEISQLCVFSSPRIHGRIHHRHNAAVSFIWNDEGGETMLPTDSVYGPNRPQVGKRVAFSLSPGAPRSRAFPALVQSG
ncbi:MAG: serine/threonine-protein kinase [Pseudomonadota bacterium]